MLRPPRPLARAARAGALTAAVLGAAAPAAGAAAVTSGPLTAVPDGAGAIRFAQDRGANLAQAARSLRFVAGGVTQTAVRRVSVRQAGAAAVVLLATDRGRRAEVRLAPLGAGAIGLHARLLGSPAATAASIAFRAPRGERYFGFGERSTDDSPHGTTIENYVSDGPFGPDSRDIAKVTIPPVGFRARFDATYYPVPWLLSGRGYGVLVARDETSTFRLPGARGGTWGADVAGPALSLQVFAGPTPAAALRRFTAATGRQPAPPAPWAFGPWLQTGQPNAPPLADQQADLEKLRAADAPVSAAETQLRYLPCGLDRGLDDYERARVAYYHRQGLAVLTYVNPMLCASYEPRFSAARSRGALLRAPDGSPSLFNSFVGGTGPAGFSIQPVGEYDFTSRSGPAAYGEVVSRMLASGHDGWMEDFGEYTALDARSADGRTGTALHNRYPTLYHCGVDRLTAGRAIVRFQRSGWTGAARCADIVWGGDPATTFGFDGLSSAVTQALSMGLSGVSRWGSDIGGYDTLGKDPKLTPELLKRWIEFGAVSAVMRMKKSGLAIPAYTRPQVWDPGTIGVWRRYAKLHTQLYPYLLAADAEYRRTGLPLMRALVLDDPADARAAAAGDEYRFGNDLLAAPVVAAGARSRAVYLPRGAWLDARTALRYDGAGDGAYHAAQAVPLRGGRTVTARAELDELPLFIRAGAVLPLLPADVSTLSAYGNGIVHLADRRRRLRLLAYPGPPAAAGMFAGESLSSATAPGRWTLRIRGAQTRRYELEASTAGLRGGPGGGAFRACAVTLGGRALPRGAWRQARTGGRLTASFAARSATLVVRAC